MVGHGRIIKGDIVFLNNPEKVNYIEKGNIVLVGNVVEGVYKSIPERFKSFRTLDYSNNLIFPGFVNNSIIYNNDESVEKLSYNLWREGVLRSNIVSIGDIESSYILMDNLENLGLGGFITHKRNNGKYLLDDLEEFCIMSSNTRILEKPFIFLEEYDKNIKEKLKLSRILNLNIIGKNVQKIKKDIISSDYGENIYFQILNLLDFNDDDINTFDSIDSLPKYNSYSPFGRKLSSVEETKLRLLFKENRLGFHTDNELKLFKAIKFEEKNRNIFSNLNIFYMITKVNGNIFNNIGNFSNQTDFDAIILNDYNKKGNPKDRLIRYLEDTNAGEITMRYVAGMRALGK